MKGAKLNSIVKYLNKELRVKKIPDSFVNGLQYRAKNNEIKKIGFAVDGTIDTFKKAIKQKCDLLIVHHGIKYRPQKYSLVAKKRYDFLKKHNLSIYGAHLPLDAHNKYGNNKVLSDMIGLEKLQRFGRYRRTPIGYAGKFKKPKTVPAIAGILNKKINTKSSVFQFGKRKVKTVAVISGKGEVALDEACKKKIDLFLTGEISHGASLRAKECGINVVAGGHYKTETVCVKALMPVLKEKFRVQAVFLNLPSGI